MEPIKNTKPTTAAPTTPQVAPAKPSKAKNLFHNYIDTVTLGFIPLLLVVVIMLYFTQIDLNGDISWKQLGIESIILYAITMAIYMLLRSYSRRKGRATDKWINAATLTEENNNKIIDEGYTLRTSEYCRAWEEKELADSRAHVLADAGITIGEFNEKYLIYSAKELKTVYPDLTEHQYETICTAKKIKRLKYDENYLSVYNKNGKRKSPSGYMQVKSLEKISVARAFITSAFSSVFMGSIVLDVLADPSFATVVMCLVKIIVILTGGVMGMLGGYNITAVKEVEEMSFKADEQKRFMMWCAANKQRTVPVQSPVQEAPAQAAPVQVVSQTAEKIQFSA